MGVEPRVLVVAADDAAAGPLCHALDALGWRTVTARSTGAAMATLSDLPLEACVFFASGLEAGGVAAVKAAAQPRTLPLILVGDAAAPDDAEAADLVMSRAPHPAQAALRLEQLGRAAISEEEFGLRRATFAAHGVGIDQDTPGLSPLRVLAAGKPDHHFLALSNCLAAVGAEVIAAPTPYTAFDYLHESAFDAALLWGGEDHAPALSIASGMKRNTRLFHIPLVLYLRGSGEINLSELYNRGFADVAAADTPEEETAARILALARTHRRHQSLRRALEGVRHSGLMDAATGLFTRQLFASHLARVAEGARARRRPLSACVLRVSQTGPVALARAGGWLDRAMPQIGAMVGRLVRVEDTAARLAPEVFALALPATTGPAARLAAERIAAVIGCTAFDAGPDRSPFVVDFDVGVAELSDGEAPGGLLERASADIRSQPKI